MSILNSIYTLKPPREFCINQVLCPTTTESRKTGLAVAQLWDFLGLRVIPMCGHDFKSLQR